MRPPAPFLAVITHGVTVTEIDLDQEEVILSDGRRLTNELAQQRADHVECGVGRRSLVKSVSPQVSFRAPQAEKDRLTRLAKKLSRRPSEVAR